MNDPSQRPEPQPPAGPDGSGLLLVLGILMVLPGLCSLVVSVLFLAAFPQDFFANPMLKIWLGSFVVGAIGWWLLYKLRQGSRR
jgi:hypothetical protein